MHPLLINALRSPCHHADPDIQRLLDKARKILEEAPASAERYATELVAGKTLAECLGIEDQTLEDSYQGACKLVDQGLFQEALILAGLVMAIGPKNAKAAFKLASCMQHLGDLGSATDYYKLALQIDQHHSCELQFRRSKSRPSGTGWSKPDCAKGVALKIRATR